MRYKKHFVANFSCQLQKNWVPFWKFSQYSVNNFLLKHLLYRPIKYKSRILIGTPSRSVSFTKSRISGLRIMDLLHVHSLFVTNIRLGFFAFLKSLGNVKIRTILNYERKARLKQNIALLILIFGILWMLSCHRTVLLNYYETVRDYESIYIEISIKLNNWTVMLSATSLISI